MFLKNIVIKDFRMRQIIGSILFTILLSFSATAQKLSPLEKKKVLDGNTAYSAGDFEGAIKHFKSVYNKHMGNAMLNSKLGFCYMYLGDIDDALDYFEAINAGSVKKKNSECFYGHGFVLQKLGRYNEALEKYKEFTEKGKPGDIKFYNVENYIAECNFAIGAKDSPVSVLIDNLGDSINSKYDDYHASMSADGNTFIFTSRREDSKGGVQLLDGQYYEDIYESSWNSYEELWGESKPVEGALNSNEYDANCSVTPDGKGIYVYRNISEETKKLMSPTGAGDIYFSKLGATGKWSAPKLVDGVNSRASDAGACITTDGQTMYFVSNRFGVSAKGAQGGYDIWVSNLEEDGTWGKPKNLGPTINTDVHEKSVFIHPNGKTLFFSSEGHYDKNMGGFDVFRTDFVDGKWTEPVNLGYPINSHRDEKEIVISTDGKIAWLSAAREDGRKDFDIYEVDLKHYNVLTGESETLSILKGKVVDYSTGLPLEVSLKITEKGTNNSVELDSKVDGSYFATFASHKTYIVEVISKGYKDYHQEITLNAPKTKKKPKRKTTTSSRRKKKKKKTQTHSVELKIELVREDPIEVVSKDLFTTQMIAFISTDEGYEINDFSKSILEMFVKQQLLAPSIVLDVSGHFEDVEKANLESKKLADLVLAFLMSKGINPDAVKVRYLGDTEPVAGNDTPAGRAANRRVEVRIIL